MRWQPSSALVSPEAFGMLNSLNGENAPRLIHLAMSLVPMNYSPPLAECEVGCCLPAMCLNDYMEPGAIAINQKLVARRLSSPSH